MSLSEIGSCVAVSALPSGGKYISDIVQITISNPITPAAMTVVGTGDNSLIPPTGYVLVDSHYIESYNSNGTFTILPDGRIQVNVDCIFKIDAYFDVTHTINNATVGVVFGVDDGGGITFNDRSIHAKMTNSGDISNMSGMGVYNAVAGDLIGLYVASDKSGDVEIKSSVVRAEAVKTLV